MEINPIARILAVPAVKLPKNDPQLSAVFDIENTFGPQQDTSAQNEGKMTGGQDDETTEQEVQAAGHSADTLPGDSGSTVNFFV